jgi:hypothetical protein
MSAGPFLIDRLVTWLWPWGRKQLDNLPHRRQIFLSLIIIGVFWAGFSAWREEKAQRIAADSAREQAQRELAQPAAQDVKRLRQQLVDQLAETKELEKALDAAQAQLAYITADRRLTTEEINTLAKLLNTTNGGAHKIVVANLSMGCPDCGLYAEDFAAAFRLAGWTVEQIHIADLNPAVRGVLVVVNDKEHPPKDALAVKTALDRSNIKNQVINTWDHIPGDDVLLIVMPKSYQQ